MYLLVCSSAPSMAHTACTRYTERPTRIGGLATLGPQHQAPSAPHPLPRHKKTRLSGSFVLQSNCLLVGINFFDVLSIRNCGINEFYVSHRCSVTSTAFAC